MDDSSDALVRAHLLLSVIVLESESVSGGDLDAAALEWISGWLALEPVDHFGQEALQHLLAIQLAPRSAIAYRSSNPVPRWRLIHGYLQSRFELESVEGERIARVVSSVLDRADMKRGPRLVEPESEGSCAICRLPFNRDPESVLTRDPFKPVWEAPEELGRPEVDHVIPIASLGAHNILNLQVVCRACNLAKGKGLVVDPDDEIRYAAVAIADVPRMHRFRLLQWIIQRCDGRCEVCSQTVGELTMRPIHEEAPLARTTLSLRCYGCLESD